MSHFLCLIGLYKWRDLFVRHDSATTYYRKCKCLRCGKDHAANYWAPLSGPYKPNWHPDR